MQEIESLWSGTSLLCSKTVYLQLSISSSLADFLVILHCQTSFASPQHIFLYSPSSCRLFSSGVCGLRHLKCGSDSCIFPSYRSHPGKLLSTAQNKERKCPFGDSHVRIKRIKTPFWLITLVPKDHCHSWSKAAWFVE